ncbi:MAG: hypothetical protein QNL04_13585 [SAR324 cluster bacterium]|nr:hypothetical protein [SAR324 cluster bacterium]
MSQMQTSNLSSDALEKNLFLKLIFFSTMLPMVLLPLLAVKNETLNSLSITQVIGVITFFGGAVHVAASGYFYNRPEFKEVFKGHPIRYFIAPVVIILATGLLFQFGNPQVQATTLLSYFLWQTYHYQRQNFGVMTFVGIATKTKPLSYFEQLAMQLSVGAGILALTSHYKLSTNTILEPYAEALYQSSFVVFKVVGILIFIVFFQIFDPLKSSSEVTLKNKLIRFIFFLMSSLFFLPAILFNNPIAAVSSYALAHGIQYLVFMHYVVDVGPKEQSHNRFSKYIIWVCIGGGIITMLGDQRIWGSFGKLIFGCYLGVIMTHFLLDAGVWKLSQSRQYQFATNAFPFLLKSKDS